MLPTQRVSVSGAGPPARVPTLRQTAWANGPRWQGALLQRLLRDRTWCPFPTPRPQRCVRTRNQSGHGHLQSSMVPCLELAVLSFLVCE